MAHPNRLTTHEDFQRVTKSTIKASTKALVGYLLADDSITTPKVGFIVPRSVGGSVVRHRVTRQLRHASRDSLNLLPNSSMVVIRAVKSNQDAKREIPELFKNLTRKSEK